MSKEKLTLKEAIQQGYTHYGHEDQEWQTVNELHDDLFKDGDIEAGDLDSLVLFDKKSRCPSVDPKRIGEILSGVIGDDDSEECMRDDDCVYDTVKELDFTETANMINKALEKHKYWMITNIKLVNHE